MKKSLIILLTVALLSVLFLSSCNVDASDGLADQVRNSAQASGIRILQLLYVDLSENIYVRSDKGIYEISDGNETAKYISDDIKAAYYNGTYLFFLNQDGELYKRTLTDTSDTRVGTSTYTKLDSNGYLLGSDSHIHKINDSSNAVDDVNTSFDFMDFISVKDHVLGRVTGASSYAFDNSSTALSTTVEFNSFVYDDSNSNIYAASGTSVYKIASSATSLGDASFTLNSSASGFAYLYNDGTNNYIVFKTSNSFDYLSSTDSYATLTILTSNWASSLRSVSLSGLANIGNSLCVSTIGNGVWEVSGIDDSEAEQIFY
ncbi:MAG: hypothetical protein K6F82_03175 [Sphaerochaetaceae bacterium]|nr:hypothetical protein [Sphaerochaetaceae bacterium]